jgi:hypothetical protein
VWQGLLFPYDFLSFYSVGKEGRNNKTVILRQLAIDHHQITPTPETLCRNQRAPMPGQDRIGILDCNENLIEITGKIIVVFNDMKLLLG